VMGERNQDITLMSGCAFLHVPALNAGLSGKSGKPFSIMPIWKKPIIGATATNTIERINTCALSASWENDG